jgi:hypothetical protein
MVVLSIDEIKTQYPDEWVLIGNPLMRDDNFVGAVIDVLISGSILYHSKDKKEIANNIVALRKGFDSTACVFTGEMPKNRRFWL